MVVLGCQLNEIAAKERRDRKKYGSWDDRRRLVSLVEISAN